MVAKRTTTTADKIELLDGKLHIFKRKDTQYWWCGFHHRGVYRRKTTAQADLREATEIAKRWYYEEQYALTHGYKPVKAKDSFKHYAQLAIADYERLASTNVRSPRYAAALKHLLERHLIPFFGDHELKSIDQSLWNEFVTKELNPRGLKPLSIKQFLNGIRVVFRRAVLRGDIKSVPTFHSERKTAAEATPRTWFDEDQQRRLITGLHQNIKDKKGTRWEFAAFELADYVVFMMNTGLRVDEGKNLKFKQIRVGKETDENGVMREILFLDDVRGKRGIGSCKSLFEAVQPFYRIINRRNLTKSWQTSDEHVFLEHHRDMFNTVLRKCDLKFTTSTPRLRRDLMSLRNTYICQQLVKGVQIWDIANTCRTSVTMIQNNYARWLSPVTANVNRSKPQTEEQKKEISNKGFEKHMTTVLSEFSKMLNEVESEINDRGDLRGLPPRKKS